MAEARGLRATLNSWATALAKTVRRAPDSTKPSGRQYAVFPGVIQNSPRPWQRALPAADWLGQYTPPWVPFWVLKIMREDPQLSLGMGAIKSVFFGIDYRFSGGDPRARAFLNKTIIEAPWFDRLKLSILNSLDFGFQTHEILWGMQDVIFDRDGPGGVDAEKIPQANIVQDFVDLDPEEISTIDIDQWRNMVGVSLGGQLASTSIPSEKLLHAIHQLEWSNWWGNSLMKRAYMPFLWVNHLSGWHVRYMEGKANPPYVGTAPTGEELLDQDKDLSQRGREPLEVLTEQMLALRGGGAAALPWEPDDKGNNKWTIRVMEDGGRADQFVTSINHLQALKLRAIWLPDRAATQDTATGSFAMADAHIELFLSILEGVKRHTMLAALSSLARRIVRANFGKSVSVPHAVASDLSRQKQALMAELVKLSLDVPLSLDDGREYTPKQLINFREGFRSLNVPALNPQEVARKPKPLAPPPGGGSDGAPAPKPNPDQGGIKEAEAEMRKHEREVIDLRTRVDGLERDLGRALDVAAPPPTPIHIHNEVQPAAAPDVHLHNEVHPSAAPDVNVEVQPASAPAVHLHNDVTVPERSVTVEGGAVNVTTPPVNVEVQAPQRGGQDVKFRTDRDGNVTGADVSPKP